MKRVLSCCAVLALIASPALAGDGNVSKSTLGSLGLSGMQVISDTDAMQVRGLSSNAFAFGASLVFGVALDPAVPGSFFVGADSNGGFSSAENAGVNFLSMASQGPQGSAAFGSVTTALTGFSSAFIGGAGFASSALGAGTSAATGN